MTRKRILLVDDDVTVAVALAGILERMGGYEVRTEVSGRKTVEAARKFKPDLILLDVVMADMDGGEVAAALENDAHLKDVPIAFLTGMISQAEMDDMGTDVDGRRLIAKLISPDDLIAAVRELLAPR